MNRLAALLGDRRPVVLDGGMGTLLQDSGLEDGAPGELWNLENQEAVRAAHRAYAEAGARVLTTNTFGGTRPRLDMHGLGDRLTEVNRSAALVARSVADEHSLPKVAASWVNRSPVSCIPSPESPAKRMTTRSISWTGVVGNVVLRPSIPNVDNESYGMTRRSDTFSFMHMIAMVCET